MDKDRCENKYCKCNPCKCINCDCTEIINNKCNETYI